MCNERSLLSPYSVIWNTIVIYFQYYLDCSFLSIVIWTLLSELKDFDLIDLKIGRADRRPGIIVL